MNQPITPPISSEFQLMAKPIGPRCNLACVYCFYREKEALFEEHEKWRMSDEILDAYCKNYIEALAGHPEVHFAWQGGEPTLMGLDFYRKAVQLQQKYAAPGQVIRNSFQTNGIVIDDDWARFFKKNGFLVGLSLDGPKEVHDPYRVFIDGRPTFSRIMRTLRTLQKHKVDFNILCSVQHLNAQKPKTVYNFFKQASITYLQFIPIVVPAPGAPGEVTEESVKPDEWGDFMCTVFDEWIRHDVGTIFVQAFDMSLAAWCGQPAPLCTFSEICGRAMIIEHNGDIYSCDHFVTPGHRLGNILEKPLKEIVDCERQQRFALDKRDNRPQFCRECKYDFVCRGECPKNRLAPPEGAGIPARPINFLCKGFYRFFEHIDPYMQQMAEALRRELPPSIVMEQFQKKKATSKTQGKKRRKRHKGL